MANDATYTVQPGDTLSGIAERELGDASRWSEIFDRNRDVISDPDQTFPGQALALPANQRATEENTQWLALLPYLRRTREARP